MSRPQSTSGSAHGTRLKWTRSDVGKWPSLHGKQQKAADGWPVDAASSPWRIPGFTSNQGGRRNVHNAMLRGSHKQGAREHKASRKRHKKQHQKRQEKTQKQQKWGNPHPTRTNPRPTAPPTRPMTTKNDRRRVVPRAPNRVRKKRTPPTQSHAGLWVPPPPHAFTQAWGVPSRSGGLGEKPYRRLPEYGGACAIDWKRGGEGMSDVHPCMENMF